MTFLPRFFDLPLFCSRRADPAIPDNDTEQAIHDIQNNAITGQSNDLINNGTGTQVDGQRGRNINFFKRYLAIIFEYLTNYIYKKEFSIFEKILKIGKPTFSVYIWYQN